MTAKELKEKLLSQDFDICPVGEPCQRCDEFRGLFQTFCETLCREQRQLVANELKTWTEDISIPNQYKIDDLCMDTTMPEI